MLILRLTRFYRLFPQNLPIRLVFFSGVLPAGLAPYFGFYVKVYHLLFACDRHGILLFPVRAGREPPLRSFF